MTLLDDLNALDIQAILDAKADLSVAIDAEDIQALINEGAVQSVLGDLGSLLSAVQEGLDDPAGLLAPLAGALAELPDRLGVDALPISDYSTAVGAGAEIVAALVAGLNGDLAPVAGLLGQAGSPIGDFTSTSLSEVGRFRALVDTAEAGLPTEPQALAALAIELLLPFPAPALGDLRTQVDVMLDGLGAIELRTGSLTGVIAAMGDVRVAAEVGDAAATQVALDRLSRLGLEAAAVLGDDLRASAAALSGLRVDLGLDAVRGLSLLIRSAEDDAVGFLDRFRGLVGEMRELVADITPESLTADVGAVLDLIEQEARQRFDVALDTRIRQLAAWLRGLLEGLGLRELRAEVSGVIHSATRAVLDADLARVADEVRAAILPLRDLVADADLAAIVADAKQQLADALGEGVDRIEASIGVITTRIEDLAVEAEAVLQRGLTALVEFRTSIESVSRQLDDLGIEELTAQVVDNLQELRAAVEELVSAVPLPEQLQSTIDSLIGAIESVDLDETVGEPLRQAAERLQLPEELGTDIEDALATVADVVSSLVPVAVIDELEAEMSGLIAAIGELDLGPLTAGIAGILDETAAVLDEVDLEEAVAPAGAVFDQLVALLDRAHPRVLLAPVITAYDSVLGQLPVPDGETLSRRVAQVTATAGEAIARGAAAPIQRLAPEGSELAPPTPVGETPSGDPGLPLVPADLDVRAGDIVRVLGFFPTKVREALLALDDGVLGETLAAIDRLCGGLARDLRRLADELHAVPQRLQTQLDAQLADLAAAQVDAQLALNAGFAASTAGIDVDVSVAVVASVGATGLRDRLAADVALVGDRGEAAIGAVVGDTAAALDRAALQLEGCALGRVVGDTDGFLAALDVEPVAAEIDALVVETIQKVPGLLTAAEAQLLDVQRRVEALVTEFNPGSQAQRLLVLLDVVKEQLDLLDPGRLADELGEVHSALRAAVLAYDPRALAAEVDLLVAEVALAIRALDPATLVGDLTVIEAQVARLAALVPTEALAGVGVTLEAVGEELAAIDVQDLLETVERLAPDVAEAVTTMIVALQTEIVALLEGVRYAQTSGGAGASVNVSIG